MAHNLEIRNGQTSFAAKGEKAWHGLGTYVTEAMSAEQAIELARLNYHVIKVPMVTETGLEVPNHFATVRTDTQDVLGVVKGRYEIIQNRDVFGFFDSVVEQGEAIYETAGVLGKGERIFITAKMPEDIIIGGEVIEKYVLLTSAHDGSGAVIAGLTPVRVVCNNTLNMALGNISNKVSIRHTTNVLSNIKMAAELMGMTSKYVQEAKETFEKMMYKKLEHGDLTQFIMQVLNDGKAISKEDFEKEFGTRTINVKDKMIDFALTHPTQTTSEATGTLWGAFNAISGYYNYEKDYKSPEAKMDSIAYDGLAAKKVQTAYDVAYSML